jgi:uncharacterized protein YggU (UPF0235/DUF167 family)
MYSNDRHGKNARCFQKRNEGGVEITVKAQPKNGDANGLVWTDIPN